MKSPFGSLATSVKMPRRRRKEKELKKKQQPATETKESPQVMVVKTSSSSSVLGLSLVTGRLAEDGQFVFCVASSPSSSSSNSTVSSWDSSSYNSPPSSPTSKSLASKPFLRHSSSFLRVADLNLDPQHCSRGGSTCGGGASRDNDSITYATSTFSEANFSYASVDPPPGVDHDPDERWVALDDGNGSHAPIAPFAVQALAQAGLASVWNESMWTPHSSKLKSIPWNTCTWPSSHAVVTSQDLPAPGASKEDSVLLWTGKFPHQFYGSDLPAVRAAGILPCSPRHLFDMLVDSDRVKEYNKLSLGRQDLLVLQNDLQEEGPFGKSITKVMRSRSQPPLVRQTMEFVSILHAQELDQQQDPGSYLCVTRAVTQPQQESLVAKGSSVLQSEILMGVNLIRRIDGDPDRCLMINVTHLRSPMVPMMIANRIGAAAAANFIKDLRLALLKTA